MKGSTVVFIFLNIIIVTPGNLQNEHDPSIPFNGLGVNSVVYALRLLGISNTDKDPSIDWKIAFIRLAEKFEAYSDLLASIAPLYLRQWIEDASSKLLTSRIGKMRTYDEMVASLGVTTDEIDRVTRKCIQRAELQKDFKLSDTLQNKVTREYVNWRYILSKLTDSTDVRVLKQLMETCGIANEEDLATEFAYLDINTSAFVVHSLIQTEKINLKTLLKGLKLYGWAYPNTQRAVTVLYKFVRGETEDLKLN